MRQDPAEGAPPVHGLAVIWIDHREARIIRFDADTAAGAAVHLASHRNGPASPIAGTHDLNAEAFHRRVAAGCGSVATLLLTGPSAAKHEFVAHLKRHAPDILARIAAIQALGPVTDQQLLADGRRVFGLTHPQKSVA